MKRRDSIKTILLSAIGTSITLESCITPEGENIANKVEVEIGLRGDGKVEIISGINEGDQIVAEGLKKVRPRGKIKPIKN